MFFRLANSQTSLDSLPSEVLVRIFDYVQQEQLASKPVEEIRPSELRTHSLFPYSLLHLCKPIRQIVLRVPRFMTLIVVFIDEFNSRSALSDLFKASGSLIIDAFFINKHVQNPSTHDIDREEVLKVLGVFSEYDCLLRCRTLVFNVRTSHSLPPVHKLSGTPPYLKTFRLFTRRLVKIPQVDRFFYGRPKYKDQISLGDFKYLTLAGSIFAQYVVLDGWAESFAPLYQKQLTIYDLDSAEMKSQSFGLYDLVEAIAKMGHFASLTLSDINLDFASCRNSRKLEIYVQNLYLKGFSSEKFSAFWKCQTNRTEYTSLTFDKCGLITDGRFLSHGMALLDITTDRETLLEFLQCWDGASLDLTRCTGVDDKLIKTMCKTTSSATFTLQTIRNLTIAYCKSSPDKDAIQTFISPKTLKRLIRKRMEAAEKHRPTTELHHTLPMWSVYLKGDGPPLPEGDLQWFQDNLERFGWYSQIPAAEEPDLVDDFAEWDWDGVVLPGDKNAELTASEQSLPDSKSQVTTTTPRSIDILPYVKSEVKTEEIDQEGMLTRPLSPLDTVNELRNYSTRCMPDESSNSQSTIPNSCPSSPYLADDYSNADWSMSDLQLMDKFTLS